MIGFWRLTEAVIRFFLNVLQNIFKVHFSDNQVKGIIQFVKFGIIGVSNTVISYVIYIVSLLAMQQANVLINIDYLIAQIVAFLLSVLWSFYWNNKYVFIVSHGGKRSVFKSLLKTYISYSFTGLFLNSVLLILWVDKLNFSEFIAPLINLMISVPLNFLINKFWAFRENKI